MSNLQLLEKLDLSYNLFAFVPTAVYDLPNLKYLDLSGNPIPEAVHQNIRKELKSVNIFMINL